MIASFQDEWLRWPERWACSTQVNELCNSRRNVTAPIALILARVFGNSPDFWLNLQRRSCRNCGAGGAGSSSPVVPC